MSYKIYTIQQDVSGTVVPVYVPAIHTVTDSMNIAKAAIAEAASRLGPGLFAIMLVDGEIKQIEHGKK